MPYSNVISLDHIQAWSSRSKLIETDLKAATEEASIRWANLMRLLVTQRVEKHGVRDEAKELAPELILEEREKGEVLEWLSDRFASRWRRHQPAVGRALHRLRRERGPSTHALKRRALRPAIHEALHDADKQQVTRIGRDRAWGHGSRLVRLQKQDLKEVAKKGLTDELIRKLTSRSAGLRVFPSDGVLRPIEAVFLREDLEPDKVRPLDLRPSLFLKWVRTRAIKLAEERLLEEAGLDPDDAPERFRKVEVREPDSDLNEEPAAHEEVSRREHLEALDREDPNPLAGLIAADEWEQVIQAATPSQREILAFLRRLLHSGEDLTEAKKTVAEELDFASRNRVDVGFSNLRSEVDDPR